MTIEIPLKVISEANAREHFRVKAKRVKQQRLAVACHMAEHLWSLPKLPARITMTRIGTRKLDSDNLSGAFKAVRDQIAEAFGVDDGSDLYDWQVRQEKGKHPGIRIEIQALECATTEGRQA